MVCDTALKEQPMPAEKMSAATRAQMAEAALARVSLALDHAVLANPDAAPFAAVIRDAISPAVPARPVPLAGRVTLAAWLGEHIGEPVPPHRLSQALSRYGWDRDEESLARTPPLPMASYVIPGDDRASYGWEITPLTRRLVCDWWDTRPGTRSGLGGRPRRDGLPPQRKTATSGR